MIDATDSVQTGSYSRSTKVDAQHFGATTNDLYHSSFTFSNNQTQGIYPIDTSSNSTHRRIHISLGNSLIKLEKILTVGPTVTITRFGPIGGYIEGNFSLQAGSLFSPELYNVNCNFKVKR